MIQRSSTRRVKPVFYPYSDGKPMGETPQHVINLLYVYWELHKHFEQDPMVFAAGNMFVYYEEGNPRKHLTPDVFLVRGIPKKTDPPRLNYLLWKNKPIDLAIEMTSKTTRREDQGPKLEIYRDIIGVKEYFLFDPFGEYLDPPLQGFRLRAGRYVHIRPVAGRLPSQVTELHLEKDGESLRLYNPATGRWLMNPDDQLEAFQRAEEERQRAVEERQRIEEENERLRQEMEELRRRLAEGGQGT